MKAAQSNRTVAKIFALAGGLASFAVDALYLATIASRA